MIIVLCILVIFSTVWLTCSIHDHTKTVTDNQRVLARALDRIESKLNETNN